MVVRFLPGSPIGGWKILKNIEALNPLLLINLCSSYAATQVSIATKIVDFSCFKNPLTGPEKNLSSIMKKNPAVSVITPSYGQTELLQLAALSVVDQGVDGEFEHLVQEGKGGRDFENWNGSQNGSDCEVRSDRGMYDAINHGFSRARGDVVAWLNCDEQYLPGVLTKVKSWFEEHPDYDLLFGDTILVTKDGNVLSYRKAIIPKKREIRHYFLSTYSAATFIRRKVLEDGHFLDNRFKAISDAVWIHHLLDSGYQAGVLNEPLAVFLQDGSNLGQTNEGKLEGIRWRRHDTLKGCFLKIWWGFLFRLRKLVNGCYSEKAVRTSVYRKNQEGRQPLAGSVGGIWKQS